MTDTAETGTAKTRYHQFKVTEDDAPLLAKLPEKFQQVLTGSGQYADMAAALNLPVGTVKSRLNRARAALIALREQQNQQAAA